MPDMPDMPGMQHGMPHHQPLTFIGEILHHDTSGTSAQPNSTSEPMIMLIKGKWTFMFHGVAFLNALQQSGPRGYDKVFSTNWFMPMAQRQMQIMTGRRVRKIDPEIKADRAVNHHGKNGRRRADQVDVGPSDMCGYEQAAGPPGQRQSDSLKHMRRPRDGRAGVPWGSVSDHVIPIPSWCRVAS